MDEGLRPIRWPLDTYNPPFPGMYYLSESGLFYNNYFRAYNPAMGRYVESDPIGLRGGINTYGYVGADPISFEHFAGQKVQRGKFGTRLP